MTNFTELLPVLSDQPVPFTDQLRLAVAAYLARFKGASRYHTESGLRCYLAWCAERGLDPCSSRRFGTATSGWASLRSLPPAWRRCRRAGSVGGPLGRFRAGCIHKGAVRWLRCGDRGMTLDLYSADSPAQ